MATHYSPKIPTEGIEMFVDAANPRSYPGSGTTWYDLSKNAHNISLGSSVTHVISEGNGVLNFPENSNGYGRNSSMNLSSSDNTIITFSRKNAGSGDGRVVTAYFNNWLLGHHDSTYGDYYANGWISYSIGGASADDTWRMFTGTGDITSDIWQLYVNDDLITENNGGSQGPNGWNLNNQYNQFSDCQIALLLCYSRVLSAEEIKTVFNCFRGRFEI